MLKAIQEKPKGIKPTHLMYKANLAHRQLKTYVDELLKSESISIIETNKNQLIHINDKGNQLYNKIKEMRTFEDAFALEKE